MSRYLQTIGLMVLVTIASADAYALGLGFYGSLQSGEVDWEIEDGFGGTADFDGGDATHIGAGFTLDTVVLKNELFNYRLDVGLERFDAELGQTNATAELYGIAADNSFGFGILRTETTRLWLGPRVRVAIYGGDFDTDSTVDIALVEFGVGGVFGANFKAGPTVAIGIEAGFMFSGYAGEIEDRFGFSDDIEGDGASLFLNGVVLFRLRGDKN